MRYLVMDSLTRFRIFTFIETSTDCFCRMLDSMDWDDAHLIYQIHDTCSNPSDFVGLESVSLMDLQEEELIDLSFDRLEKYIPNIKSFTITDLFDLSDDLVIEISDPHKSVFKNDAITIYSTGSDDYAPIAIVEQIKIDKILLL